MNVLRRFQESLRKVRNWNQYFCLLDDMSPKDLMYAEDGFNMDLNRYIDIIPLEHSKITLTKGQTKYINANTLYPFPYILSQGPLLCTVQDHWQMIAQEKISIIVMLCSSRECSQYWPSTVGNVLVCPKYDLEVLYQSEEDHGYFIIRTFLLKDFSGKLARIIKHFNYQSWPDFGVPQTIEPFLNFVNAIQNYENQSGVFPDSQNDLIKLVHCLAGIGRSGSYTLIDHSIRSFRTTGSLTYEEVEDTLIKMRHSRLGLIQTYEQLQFSFYVILEALKKNIVN